VRDFIAELRRRNVLRVLVAYLAFAWLIVQVLETVLPVFDVSTNTIRWVIVALAILLLPVLAFAWIFEWSASGLETQTDIDRGLARARPETRRFDRAIIIVLSVAVLFFAVERFLLPGLGMGAGGAASVAVLPFSDQSPDGSRAYLADGLAEEVLNILGKNPRLRVAARTSSFSFRNARVPVGDIAQMLNVSHVLEGSIRPVDQRIRISVRLVSAADGFNVWSQVFDIDTDDLFSVTRNIRQAVERALGVPSTPAAANDRVPHPDAYGIALRAGYLSRENTTESRQQAVEAFKEALAIDPDMGEVWSNLSTTYANQAIAGDIGFNDGYRLARDAAVQAIEAAPGSGAGYKALSFVQRYFEGEMSAAVSNLEMALQREPFETSIHGEAVVMLLNIGQLDDAVHLQERIQSLSPLDHTDAWNLALHYRYVDRLEDSERMYRRVEELQPNRSNLEYNLGETLLLQGRYAEALERFQAESDEAYRLKGTALALYSLGRNAESDRALAEMIEKFGERWPSEVVHVHAWRGEIDEAFVWLDREFETYGPGGWGEWQLQRLYDNLRNDPRWTAFLRRTGTAPEQLAALQLQLPPNLLER